jgi:PIN domain nuclease of toxin-antitoxin system
VKLLLDTPVVLWALAEPARLAAKARGRIVDPATTVAVSAASVWDIARRVGAGRLRIDGDLRAALADADLLTLPITAEHALAAGALPAHHDDPLERMLVAQALVDGWTLVSRNAVLAAYGVPVLAA